MIVLVLQLGMGTSSKLLVMAIVLFNALLDNDMLTSSTRFGKQHLCNEAENKYKPSLSLDCWISCGEDIFECQLLCSYERDRRLASVQ